MSLKTRETSEKSSQFTPFPNECNDEKGPTYEGLRVKDWLHCIGFTHISPSLLATERVSGA
uniref:Uncharacterized protein n=1 Tax=Arion vulgaris TaxID=1028688 RepID=A0A0B7ANF9_9EUPU